VTLPQKVDFLMARLGWEPLGQKFIGACDRLGRRTVPAAKRKRTTSVEENTGHFGGPAGGQGRLLA